MSIKLFRHTAGRWYHFRNVSDTEIKFSIHLKVMSVFVPKWHRWFLLATDFVWRQWTPACRWKAFLHFQDVSTKLFTELEQAHWLSSLSSLTSCSAIIVFSVIDFLIYNGNWTERSTIYLVWNHLRDFKTGRARSASTIWNHKYDFRSKLHDTTFNYHFITVILKS